MGTGFPGKGRTAPELVAAAGRALSALRPRPIMAAGAAGPTVLDEVSDPGPYPPNQDACETARLPGGRTVISVADGVSGARHGGDAARLAARTALEAVVAMAPRWTPEDLREVVLEVNRQLLRAEPRGQYQTTLVVLALDPGGGQGFCAYSGDSWAGCLSRDETGLRMLTRSHGEAARLEQQRIAGPLGARILANSAMRGLGCDYVPPVGVEAFQVRPGDLFVVATDGLDVLQEREIPTLLRRAGPASAARRLFQQARGRGLNDNVTVATAALPPHRRGGPALALGVHLRWVPTVALAAALAAVLAADAGWSPPQRGPWTGDAALVSGVGASPSGGGTPSSLIAGSSPVPAGTATPTAAEAALPERSDPTEDSVAADLKPAPTTAVAGPTRRPSPTPTATPEPDDLPEPEDTAEEDEDQ